MTWSISRYQNTVVASSIVRGLFSPLGWLVGFWLLSGAHQAVYAHYGVEGSALSHVLWQWGTSLLIVWWVQDDERQTGYRPCYEYAAFMFFGWPLLLPDYLLRTRGIRGLLWISAFSILFFTPWLFAIATFYLAG